MEKLRADKLNYCSVMIQKTIKAWMQWRKYQRLRRVTILLQAHTRGLLARRLVAHYYAVLSCIIRIDTLSS